MNDMIRIYYNYFKKKTNVTVKTKEIKKIVKINKIKEIKTSINKPKKIKTSINNTINIQTDIYKHVETNGFIDFYKGITKMLVKMNDFFQLIMLKNKCIEIEKCAEENVEVKKYNIEKIEVEKSKKDRRNTQIILKTIIELINGGFVIYGDFCNKILNNMCKNEIDICCTIYQYIYFGNISLYELSDKQLCDGIVNYLKTTLIDFDNNFVGIKIMKSKIERYIILYYNIMKINIKLNMENINKNFMCNMIQIQKKKMDGMITIDDFSKCLLMDGRSDNIIVGVVDYENIPIVNVVKHVKMKYAYCFHGYKIHNNKIIFNQMCYSGKSLMCLKFPYICNIHQKKNRKNGLCPCRMNIFIREFICLNNNGYVVILGNNLKINYNDVTWPQTDNDVTEQKINNRIKEKKKIYYLRKPKSLYVDFVIYKIIKRDIDKYSNLYNWSYDKLPPLSLYKPNYILMSYYGYKIILCDEYEIFQNNLIDIKTLVNKCIYCKSIYYQTITY